MDMNRFEDLGGGLLIEVSDDHTFGEDALRLAAFSAPRRGERVCELCAGCGVISLLWCRDTNPENVTAFEIQQQAADMARRSAAAACYDDRLNILAADLRMWRDYLPPGSQSMVAVNPPYFREGSGKVSANSVAGISRHEGIGCTLTDVAEAAAGLLKEGGRLDICHRPERLCDVMCALHAVRLEPKRIQFITGDNKSEPWLFLCEAVKGAAPGLRIEL